MPPRSSTARRTISWHCRSSSISPGTVTAFRPASPNPFGRLLSIAFLGLKVGDQHVGALPGEGDGHGAADAGVTAGNDCPFAAEPASATICPLAVVRLGRHILCAARIFDLLLAETRRRVLSGRVSGGELVMPHFVNLRLPFRHLELQPASIESLLAEIDGQCDVG